jgi:CelD/BcsL family acetyltransferase involved in cellulose biosynthesis
MLSMRIHTSKFEKLAKEQLHAWSEIQRSEPHLSSPYFRPEFTRAVAAVRSDVEVGVLTEGTQAVGFFPFQRSGWNVAYPVGAKLSDFHGLIVSTKIDYDPRELLRSCGLRAWHFSNLLCEQRAFSPFVCREADSPYVDLSNGMDAYIAGRENGRRLMSKHGQSLRKLSREIGPVRLEPHIPDPAIVSMLLAWKSNQLRRMRVPNIFDYCWVRNLLEKILEYKKQDFSPVISVLYAGDTVAAISFALRTRSVLHAWIQAYNVDLARYSPGLMCSIEIMKAAESLGVGRIDFGSGPERYKYRIMSRTAKVGEGTADLRQSAAIIRRTSWTARDSIRMSCLAQPARVLAQKVRRVRHWLDTRIANRRTCI